MGSNLLHFTSEGSPQLVQLKKVGHTREGDTREGDTREGEGEGEAGNKVFLFTGYG